MGVLHDLRLAVRLLVKGKWVTLVAAVTLALGIAANSTVFTLVNAVLLRGVPFPEADRVVAIGTRDARNRNLGVSYYDFLDWREASRSFSELSLMGQPPFNVSEEGRAPERYNGAYVSANLFQLIGAQAMLGRGFIPEDDLDGAQPVTVLGYGIWQSRYAGDPAILGKTITINDQLATVVGVMTAGMQFPPNTDLWLPLGQATITRGQTRQVRIYRVMGRLADGVTIQQAQSELATIAARLAHDYPETNTDVQPTVRDFNETTNGSQLRTVFWLLMGAVAFVLLIACGNVANLLLARAAERAKEVGIRISLGATRARVVRQLLVEAVLLALFGGLLGVPLAYAGIRIFDALTQDVGKPYWMAFTVDPVVFLFFFAVCFVTGLAFGLAPALHVSKTSLNEVLKEGGRSASSGVRARRWTSGLLVVQVALTLVLLGGAGFMMRSFLQLYSLDLPIDTSSLLTMQLTLNDRKYPTSEHRYGFARRLDERLAGISGLEAVTTTSNVPLGGGMVLNLAIEGRPNQSSPPPRVTLLSVGRHYFDTLGLPIVRGRAFGADDEAQGHSGAVVNQQFVDLYFRGEDPLGRQIRLTDDSVTGAITVPPLTIVGVSATLRQREMQGVDPDAVVYVPHPASGGQVRTLAVVLRTAQSQAAVVPEVRKAVYELDSDLPLFNVRTMDEVLARQRWPYRVFGGMFTVFAVMALLLAAVGLYAATAYSVAQRTQEIGVRMVLGAEPRQVVWLFLRRVILLVASGLLVGMGGAIGVGRLLQGVLVQTTALNPAVLLLIATIMAAVAVAACVWPARRATRLDPVAALRCE